MTNRPLRSRLLRSPMRFCLNRLHEIPRLALRRAIDELRIDWISRRSARRLARLSFPGQHLKVHLGCGSDIRGGWVNIDMKLSQAAFEQTHSGTVVVNYDLRRGLPLREGSCTYVYSSHFFEHLEPQQAYSLMCDSYRILLPGATLRPALPKQHEPMMAYLNKDWDYFKVVDTLVPKGNTGAPRMNEILNYHFYQNGQHKFVIDEETALAMLRCAGFRHCGLSRYKEDLDLADDVRRKYSFYVEAQK